MKKNLLSFLLILFFITEVVARPIDKTEALTLVKNYFSTSSSKVMRVKSNANYELIYVGSDKKIPDNTEGNQNYFYVYNIGENNGFVIVSADTRTKSILGYSNTGRFNVEKMPENLKDWLQVYSGEIKYAIEKLPEAELRTSTPEKVKKAPAQTTSVQPLLGSIVYDQDAPYNDSCPSLNNVKTVTGCVATAIAQVMRYHQWPVTGTGSKTYTTSTNQFALTANFGTTNYDWANMRPFYTGTETNAQKAAVAKLMLHVGISVGMNYNTAANGGSSANTQTGVNVLYDNFGYDAGIQGYYRGYFTRTSWADKLKQELNAGRPVVYSGRSDAGGHAFVCDGYDNNNLFHFNWGWSGVSNGFYELSALNPDVQGIGSSNGGYNVSQTIITGIQKPVAGSVHSQVMGLDSIIPSVLTIPKATGTVSLTLKAFYNIGRFTYTGGSVAFGMYRNGIFVNNLDDGDLPELKAGWGWSSIKLDNFGFSQYENGDYELKLLYRNEKNEYVPALVSTGGVGTLNVHITDTNVSFTIPNTSPTLALTAAPTTINNLYQKKNGQFQVSIANTGGGEYYAQIGIKLTKTDEPTVTQNVITSLTQIGAGETKTITLSDSVKVAPGTYFLNVYYDATNDETVKTFPTILMGPAQFVPTVTVLATPTDAPVLSLVEAPTLPVNIVQGEDFTVTARIQNTGGLFDNKVVAFIFPSTGGTSLDYFGYQNIILDNNANKTVNFTGNTTIAPATYKMAMYSRVGTSWKQIPGAYNLTVTAATTALKSLADDLGFKLINNPIENEINVLMPDNAKSLSLYTLQGQLLTSVSVKGERNAKIAAGNLTSGIYLLKLETQNGASATIKCIKK